MIKAPIRLMGNMLSSVSTSDDKGRPFLRNLSAGFPALLSQFPEDLAVNDRDRSSLNASPTA